MGLRVVVHQRVTALPADYQSTDQDLDRDDRVRAFVDSPTFVRSLRGLHDGWYQVDDPAQSFTVGEWSYGGYSRWRQALAELAGYAFGAAWADPLAYQEIPFFELVNFSDTEGTIGPLAALDLATDFVNFEDRARAAWAGGENDHHWEDYRRFAAAAVAAAPGGLIEFR